MRTYPLSYSTLKTFKDIPLDLFEKAPRGYRLFFKAGSNHNDMVCSHRMIPETLFARIEDFERLLGYPIDVARSPLGKKYLIPSNERGLAFQRANESLLLMKQLGIPAHELDQCWEMVLPTIVLCFSREDIAPHFEPLLWDIPLTFSQAVQSSVLTVFLCFELGIRSRSDLEEVSLASLLQFIGISHLSLEVRNREFDRLDERNFDFFTEKFELSQKLVKKMAVPQWVKHVSGRFLSCEHLSDKENKKEDRVKHWVMILALEVVSTQLPPGVEKPKKTLRNFLLDLKDSNTRRYPVFFQEMLIKTLYYFSREAS